MSLCALLLGPSLAGAQAQATRSGECRIDAIFGSLSTSGYLGATGFAFDSEHGAPVRKVELTLDGAVAGEVSLRGLRPDVLAHFARQDYLWSGWNGEVSLEGVRPGVHSVDIVAIDHAANRIPCGRRTFTVVAAPEVPSRTAPVIGGEILLRTALLLAWLAVIGGTAGALLRAPAAGSPFLGLALFGVFAELGGALHVKPSRAALALSVLCLAFLARLLWKRLIRLRRPPRASVIVVAISTVFAAIAVIPLASHGEGAVLGDIDDASRECVVADSYSRFGWRVPSDVGGYLASIRDEVETHHVRPGGIYLLSALADSFHTRAHEVHSVAILATGCLTIWGVGFLARMLSRGRGGRFWPLAPVLIAVNSTLLATLYGQHLGSLLGAALLLPFLAFSVRLVRVGGYENAFAVGLLIAAGLVFYPEALPVWALAVPLTLLTTNQRARRRAAFRLALALVLGAALNPIGLVRTLRFARDESQKLSTPYERLVTGDTHYFPPPTVVLGIEAYREDAAAPVGVIRRILIPVAGGMILVTSVIGWLRSRWRDRAVIVLLLAPVAVALLANVRLSFPYGYAKFLPMAAAAWSFAFAFLVQRALERSITGAGPRPTFAFAMASVLLAGLLALPSLRHVLQRAVRSVPAYDPAYRILPALAGPVGRRAVIVVDEPVVASREWMRYFFGENAVFVGSESLPQEASSKYLLVDRRRDPGKVIEPGSVSSRMFALKPLGVRR